MSRVRMMLLLANLALLAGFLAKYKPHPTFSDGD